MYSLGRLLSWVIVGGVIVFVLLRNDAKNKVRKREAERIAEEQWYARRRASMPPPENPQTTAADPSEGAVTVEEKP